MNAIAKKLVSVVKTRTLIENAGECIASLALQRWNGRMCGFGKMWIFVLVLLCTQVVAVPVRANGHYVISYSGGLSTFGGTTFPYTTFVIGIGFGGYGTDSHSNPSVSCIGQITATFVWQESFSGEPPPDSVITYEYSSASAVRSYGYSQPNLTATNGM